MKKSLAAIAVLSATLLRGQDLQFVSHLSYEQALPPIPTSLSGRAEFTLKSDGFFWGQVWVDQAIGTETVQLFQTTSAENLGTPVFTFEPSAGYYPDPGGGGSYGVTFLLLTNLTPGQIDDLDSGKYWVNAASSVHPGESVRGQIVAVPEPSIFTLTSLGLVCLVYFARRQRG